MTFSARRCASARRHGPVQRRHHQSRARPPSPPRDASAPSSSLVRAGVPLCRPLEPYESTLTILTPSPSESTPLFPALHSGVLARLGRLVRDGVCALHPTAGVGGVRPGLYRERPGRGRPLLSACDRTHRRRHPRPRRIGGQQRLGARVSGKRTPPLPRPWLHKRPDQGRAGGRAEMPSVRSTRGRTPRRRRAARTAATATPAIARTTRPPSSCGSTVRPTTQTPLRR